MEDLFSSWASAPSQSEQDRCENAIKAIKNAIAASDRLKYRNIKVFPQGSYHNNTNVKRDSDVDVGIVCFDVFFPDYPEETTKETFGNIDGDYDYSVFKNEVEIALKNYFGISAVSRGNKAFDIKENSYHVEADVAPFFEHRRYNKDGSYLSGVELRPDNNVSSKVINWPDHHYDNGVKKNNFTNKRYKRLVRIIKALSNHMEENGIAQAKDIMGFLVECLIWNVPNNYFGYATYTQDVNFCLNYLADQLSLHENCSGWGEVSELKYLFGSHQKWTREQAYNFVISARSYIK